MVLMALFTTFITTPIVMSIYKPARREPPYKHRTVERDDMDTEFRMLACFPGSLNLLTIISVVECSRGTGRRSLTVYAMHFMELSERSSSISMVHKVRRKGLPFGNKAIGNSDQLVVTFEAYRQLSSVTVRPLTAISDLKTIHEDIIASAQQKRAALIILPFHKVQQMDGGLESIGHDYRLVNQRVLQQAPCSVAVLVDRGLGGTTQVASSEISYAAAVLFFGGADDREALAYGARMAEHPGIALTVLRFCPAAANPDDIKQDEECIAKFRASLTSSTEAERSVWFEEAEAADSAGIIAAIKRLGRFNLFLVGRSSSAVPLAKKSDCPELGPVGGYLALSEFSTITSVLVIQRYVSKVEASTLV